MSLWNDVYGITLGPPVRVFAQPGPIQMNLFIFLEGDIISEEKPITPARLRHLTGEKRLGSANVLILHPLIAGFARVLNDEE